MYILFKDINVQIFICFPINTKKIECVVVDGFFLLFPQKKKMISLFIFTNANCKSLLYLYIYIYIHVNLFQFFCPF